MIHYLQITYSHRNKIYIFYYEINITNIVIIRWKKNNYYFINDMNFCSVLLNIKLFLYWINCLFDNALSDVFSPIFSVVGGTGTVDDYDFMNMDLVSGDMDVPVDFSSINVSDLMAYNKSTWDHLITVNIWLKQMQKFVIFWFKSC